MGRLEIYLTVFSACLAGASLRAETINIQTPIGPIPVELNHAGPEPGDLVEVDAPQSAGFRPPAVFAAPLPTGSGARALGQAGAFTAVADDATAASWNPAGLTQLETPEVSVVYRFSAREDSHSSSDSDLSVGRDRYSSQELNYASAVYPFLLNGRNAVVSLNYQEAYDFTQTFTADFRGASEQTVNWSTNQTFYESSTISTNNEYGTLTLFSETTTEAGSDVTQLLSSSLLSKIDFRQQGTIDAFSPAFAFNISPRFSVGVAVNVYTDGSSRGNRIESEMVTDYSGISDSSSTGTVIQVSTKELSWEAGVYTGPPHNPSQSTNYVSGGSDPVSYTNETTTVQDETYTVEGHYREDNVTDQFYGFNATIGALWTVSDKLTLGASVDLPWTGRGEQTKHVNHQVFTYDSNLVQVAEGNYQNIQKRDVEYTFPLYWAVGGLWRWNDRFYTSMDVSCTHWSQFSYKAEGEERINPLNGESHSSSKLDDCWSVRCGGEYLCILSWTEIPLRGGVFWEQRPAIGSPDEYWGVSLGSGISLGKEPGRMVLDIAYTFERGENVMGSLLPEQGTASDVNKHQVFVSAIWHF